MAIPTNQLKSKDQSTLTLALPYGRHVGAGHLTMSVNSGGISPNHQVKLRQALCEGPIDSIEGVWYAGTGLAAANYTLYNGTQTTAPAAPFAEDFSHFGTAMLNVTLEVGMADADDLNSPPDRLSVMGKFLKVADYDSSGVEGSTAYSVSPARVVADLMIKRGRLATSWINWSRWSTWKTYNDTTETVDYSVDSAKGGIGLKGSYYNDTSFTTLVLSRTDPSIYFDASAGSPAFGINVDSFGVRWEGKILTKAAGIYTFKLDHSDTGKLWITDMTTPIINGATTAVSSTSVELLADRLYNIKIEWTDTSGDAKLIFYWTPPSETEQVVPQDYLYPKAESKARYEAHALFETPTDLDDGVRHVLTMSNSFMQQADGKYNFYNFEELTPTFAFTAANITDGTMKFYRRDRRDLRNRFEAVFRDLESQYLEVADPPVVVEYQNLQDDQGRIIDSGKVDLDTMTHWQARKVLTLIGKRDVEMDMFAEFDADGSSYAVLPGDLVTITHSPAAWTAKQFLVLSAVDYSPEASPDRRGFMCLEWA